MGSAHKQTSVATKARSGAGKRAGRRSTVCLELTVTGRGDAFSGQTVDLSRTGALIWISDERFLPRAQAGNMVSYSERVAEEFASGMKIAFAGGSQVHEAEVVRVTREGADKKRGPLLVACRFAGAISEDELRRIGPDGAANRKPQARPQAKPKRKSATPGARTERRGAVRTDRILYVEVQGDYGAYKAQALNVSSSGVLLTITDQAFTPPAEPDQLVVFTKRLGFQFGNGMRVRFLETDISVQADVVRVNERSDHSGTIIVIGGKFRRALTQDECALLEVEGGGEAEPIAGAHPVGANPHRRKTQILRLMREAMEFGATDLHIKVGVPPRVRQGGMLLNVGNGVVDQAEAHAMALDLMTPKQAATFDEEGDVELAHTIEGVGRYRVNVLRQRGRSGLAIRCIPSSVPTLDDLGLSPLARTLAEKPRGLVLVTGPTGSGKSTTLAAMLNHVNHTRPCHIVTMEDPIEYIHTDAEAHITQREIGRDTISFRRALTRALRQDPDVILVGEMRDLETISLALTAAETGHLVFATLHTTSAALTPGRIVDVFPPAQQTQIRLQLADSLQGIMSQMLLPRIDGSGVVVAQEIVVATEAVRALIRENKTPQILNMMQTGAKEGMQTLESALTEMVRSGVISHDTAVAKANFPKQIRP